MLSIYLLSEVDAKPKTQCGGCHLSTTVPTNCLSDLHRLQPIVKFLTSIFLTFVLDLYLVYGLKSELYVINFFFTFLMSLHFLNTIKNVQNCSTIGDVVDARI